MKASAKLSAFTVLLLAPILLFGLGASPVAEEGAVGAAEIEMGGGGHGYAGSEACAACHEGQAQSIAGTTHGKTSRANWDGATGCESCHGPGQAHIDEADPARITNLANLSPQEASDICLQCHERGERKHWKGSAHDGRGVSCLGCHKIHHEGTPTRALLAQGSEFDTCRQCHLQKSASMYRSAHMPVREDIMSCASCHNPHGSLGPAQLRQFSVNENCYSCHAEKRAPKLWEHPPVRENCASCHEPHGSVHAKMLNARMPWLCQQCHDEARHPTEAWDSPQDDSFFPARRAHFNKACVNCHTQVHGSNHPSGPRFMR